MKVLLLGSSGQLGSSIIIQRPKEIELFTFNRSELNILNKNDLKEKVREIKPNWIINSAAYTNVEQAEINRDLALKVNRDGPRNISEVVKEIGGNLLHISTDFVFDGNSFAPYKPTDQTNPLSYYGTTKLLGENEVLKIRSQKNKIIILRTSWLMGPFGKNFAKTMLKLHQENDLIKVVHDQTGCPTSTISLANICWAIINKNKQDISFDFPEIMHWSDKGQSNWYEVAKEIGEIGIKLNKISKTARVVPIKSSEYKTKAVRPLYSILDIKETERILEINSLNWKESLFKSLKEY